MSGAREPTLERAARVEPLDEREYRVVVRRALFLILVALTTVLVSLLLLDMIRANGTTALEYPIFVLTVLLLVPITVSFWMAVFGFVIQASGSEFLELDLSDREGQAGRASVPVAIVVPIFNEDPARVLAGITATRESLEETGQAGSFEFFVLSDTMDPRRWIEEERAIASYRRALPDPTRLHYRNRQVNSGKKAGNIADFCRTYGDRYRYMIVFDADSVMSGTTLVRLVRAMERHREVGILQAPPVPVNRRTLFGRVQQFAARAYGPTWATGLAALQSGEGNYYGHNAILRIRPFMEHCRLPKLPGKAPLGGHVLSHDFVEAALMRRAGYKVHLAPDLGGSFEEAPPTLIDFAARDHRWCQGNLQHARLVAMPGLHPVSRLQLSMGVMAYLSSPLWLLLLLLSTAEALRWQLSPHQYFAPGGSLFPIWEVSVTTQATILFAIVLALLFVPRALALSLRISRARERQGFGGAARVLASGAFEWLFSSLLAPTLALTQSLFVASILMGRSTGWNSQTRADRGTNWAEASRRHGGVVLLGIAWTWILARYSTQLMWWMLPVSLGMALAIPLSISSSRVAVGDWARKHGLLLTPEEVDPEPVLRRWREELAKLPERETELGSVSALERVLSDPVVRAAHRELAILEDTLEGTPDPLHMHELQGLVLKCRLHGPAALTDEEQRTLLLAPRALDSLLVRAGDDAAGHVHGSTAHHGERTS